MGNLSRLSAKCRKCPYVDKCKQKRIEAEAYLEPIAMPTVAEIMQPVAVKHSYRDVKVAENTTLTIDLEDLKKQMERDFYKQAGLGLQFGG